MAHFQEVVLNEATTQEQREAWSRQYEYQQRQNGQAFKPAEARAEITGRTLEMVAGREGTVQDRGRTQTACASPGLRPGHVIVGGIETTVDVALREGLISPEEASRAGFNQPAERNHRGGVQSRGGVQAGNFPSINLHAEEQPRSESGRVTGGQQEVSEGDTPEGDQTSPEAAARAASEAIQSIEQAHGPAVVDVGLDEVAEGGYLPDADELPEGVSMEAVEKIVAGYTAQANDALSAVGASVNMLMETMTDDELREARRATLMGDSAKLQHLGQQSAARLATLPSADPEAFAEMVADMRPQEREALSQNEKGEWIVTVPGRPAMSFGAAVRAGIARV